MFLGFAEVETPTRRSKTEASFVDFKCRNSSWVPQNIPVLLEEFRWSLVVWPLNLQFPINVRPEGCKHSARNGRKCSEDDSNFLRTSEGTEKIDNTTEAWIPKCWRKASFCRPFKTVPGARNREHNWGLLVPFADFFVHFFGISKTWRFSDTLWCF